MLGLGVERFHGFLQSRLTSCFLELGAGLCFSFDLANSWHDFYFTAILFPFDFQLQRNSVHLYKLINVTLDSNVLFSSQVMCYSLRRPVE